MPGRRFYVVIRNRDIVGWHTEARAYEIRSGQIWYLYEPSVCSRIQLDDLL